MNFKINGLILVGLLFFTITSTTAVNFDDSSETGMILIGDTGKDNDGQLNVSRSIQDFCTTEKCDLGLMAGDNVYPAGLTSPTDTIMERLFDAYYNPLNFPFLISLGNHDYGKFSNDWKRGAWQIKHAEKNPAFQIPNYYYIHETKEAVIAVIDTSRLMWRKETFAQADMLAEAYARANGISSWATIHSFQMANMAMPETMSVCLLRILFQEVTLRNLFKDMFVERRSFISPVMSILCRSLMATSRVVIPR